MYKLIMIFCFSISVSSYATAQLPAANYDESKVGHYPLPDVLKTASGKAVKTAKEWEKIQRPHILKLFEKEVYGRVPAKPQGQRFVVKEESSDALNGKAIRRQLTIYFSPDDTSAAMNVILYLPKAQQKVPVFIGLNFMGNTTIDADSAILPSRFVDVKEAKATTPEEAIAKTRGAQARRWPLEHIIDAGFGVATACYEDIEEDNANGWQQGIRSKLNDALHIQPDEWSALAVWAWGLSRIQDYLETVPEADAAKTIVTGHSRLGKAALWAAANDPRFAMIVSNNSGEGGAALARRNFGETTKIINNAFPHWFVQAYKKYNDHPEKLPIDQHMLLALMAPRPLYVASASNDTWADPKGELLSAYHASKLYQLYGLKGLHIKELPQADQSFGDHVRYHIRTGDHDILPSDWAQYIRFAQEKLKQGMAF